MAVKLDSSSSWIVAISVCVILTSSVWVFRCSSILYVGFFERVGLSREEAAWPLTAFFVSSCFSGPVVGTLSQRIPIRKLFLFSTCFNCFAVILSTFATDVWQLSFTLGILLGSSAGIPVTLAGAFVIPYFLRYRTAAVGVYMAGSSILSIVAPSIMQFCLERYEFSGMLLLFSGLSMQGIPAALLLFTIDIPEAPPPAKPAAQAVRVPLMEKPSEERIDINPSGKRIPIVVLRQLSGNRVRRDTPHLSMDDNASATRSSVSQLSIQSIIAKKSSVLQVFQKKWFYIMALSHSAFSLNLSTLLNLMEDFGRDKNLDPLAARNLIGVFASTDLLARLGSTWITDGGFIAREHLFMLNFTLKALCLISLGVTSNSIAIFCLVAFLGWLFGSTVVLFIEIVRERLGLQQVAFAYGWYLFFGGLLGLTRPKAIGFFREQVGSYDPIMYLLAGLSANAVLVYLTVYLLEKKDFASEMRITQELTQQGDFFDSGRIRSDSFTPSI